MVTRIAFQLTGPHADLIAIMFSVSCPSGALTPAKILFWSASPAAAAQLPAEADASAPRLSEAVIWVHPAASSDAHAALLNGAIGSQLPHNMVLPLHLKDPRLAKPIKAAEALATLEEASSQASLKVLPQPPSYNNLQPLAPALAQERAPEGCPALAVRRAAADGKAAPGWSLILPAGWASLFWQALVYNRARPAGQREWRWAAAHQGVGFFPHDFPDTPAPSKA
ncbi:hypothetical protein COCSUDRAFT_83559 [Coccomyxa subellipsoidea C-169]|uniref:POPLD domain-containing protein n=1 Tax=Coccomyxa subellipsoidea (strain C-169) TaxID=574566 RepID=I0YM89_COCSC|nr:hypothetical protein COCSUDRAFT_83559 [Coccomyxa subellipsoidea C-169]EIE19508.1 hypothetical protein COCSUDRAFT_83559 [Coccomyxa subellipsoidea C-169]|eukprot:XP_005644052.1 hypothetical protein COCSUDRAFT_83559 [Coccomyxa subellipsoidea C-169]